MNNTVEVQSHIWWLTLTLSDDKEHFLVIFILVTVVDRGDFMTVYEALLYRQ